MTTFRWPNNDLNLFFKRFNNENNYLLEQLVITGII